MLVETLEKKINELMEKLDDNIDISEELLSTLENFSESVLKNEESLADIEKPEDYLTRVYEETDEKELNEMKENIKSLKLTTEAIKDASEDESVREFFALEEQQKEFLRKVCEDTKEYIKKSKEKLKKQKEVKDDIDIYKRITDKAKNNEEFDANDLNVIFTSIEKFDTKEKYEIYRDFLMHNIKTKNKKEEAVGPLTIEEIIEVFKSVEDSEKRKLRYETIIREYTDEMVSNFDSNRYKEIAEFFKEKGIFEKFELEVLLGIALYGDIESIKNTFKELEETKDLENQYVYTESGVWCNHEKQAPEEEVNVSRIRKRGGGPSKLSLKDKSHIVNRKEFYKRMEALIASGIPKEEIQKKPSALRSTAKSIKSQLKVFDLYNIHILEKSQVSENAALEITFKGTTFSTGYLAAERCDMAIECGILDPTINEVSPKTYVNNNPSILKYAKYFDGRHALLLQTLKEGEITNPETGKKVRWDDAFGHYLEGSTEKRAANKLNDNFKTNYLGFNLKKAGFQKFLEDQNMDGITEKDLPRYTEMQDEIIPNLVEFKNETYESEFIKELDNNYKTNDFMYSYNGKTLSRLKVLRIYESLKKYNADNPDKAFDEEDIRLFALTYNTFFNKDMLKKLIEEIYKDEKRRAK